MNPIDGNTWFCRKNSLALLKPPTVFRKIEEKHVRAGDSANHQRQRVCTPRGLRSWRLQLRSDKSIEDLGHMFDSTINGFAQLINQFSNEAQFVVWLNPYWGAIEHEGKAFEQMKVYRENKDRISALIQIPDLKKETYGRDLTDMLQQKQTFNEALKTQERSIMTRQRLKLLRDQLFGQRDQARVI